MLRFPSNQANYTISIEILQDNHPIQRYETEIEVNPVYVVNIQWYDDEPFLSSLMRFYSDTSRIYD